MIYALCFLQDVMDVAIYLHHTLARRLILKYGGYESMTEGDRCGVWAVVGGWLGGQEGLRRPVAFGAWRRCKARACAPHRDPHREECAQGVWVCMSVCVWVVRPVHDCGPTPRGAATASSGLKTQQP
jgi:hypothetical protein